MELNIDTSSNGGPPASFASQSTEKVKGSWRKRRRIQLIERSKLNKRTNRNQKKTQAQHLQAQEFESGVDKEEKQSKADEQKPATKVGSSSKGTEHINKKKRNSKYATTDEGNNTVKETNEQTNGTNSKRQKSSSNSSAGKHNHSEKPDQTPKAINETLKILGSSANNDTNINNTGEEIKEETKHEEEPIQNSFEEVGLYHSICYHLENRMNIQNPTQVQEKVLEKTLNLKQDQSTIDLLIRSPTGSGKTFSYLFPIAHYLLNRTKRTTREDGALALIIVPTHELAEQVSEQAKLLFQPWHWIVVGRCIGGENKRSEKARLRKGINILISTPGRLLDHMRNTQSFQYRLCEFLVLDEADRLLDLGFENDIKSVIQHLNSQAEISNPDFHRFRSNFLLSATLSNDVKHLAKFSLQNPVEIIVDNNNSNTNDDSKFSMPTALNQHFCIVEQKYRLITLACFLRLKALKDISSLVSSPSTSLPTCKIIVFFSTCDSVDFHYEVMKHTPLPEELKSTEISRIIDSDKLIPLNVYKLHGNHTQVDRAKSLRDFRNSDRSILLCTDVAARGLDLKGLTFTIQYDPPTGGEGEELEYLHRAGRTGRMGVKGDALLFLLPTEHRYVSKLKKSKININEISGSAAIAALLPNANLNEINGISYATRVVTSSIQNQLDDLLNNNQLDLKEKAVAGFQAYCRAYATHSKDVKHFFHVRNLHLGHVARAFILSDKPAEFNELVNEYGRSSKKNNNDDSDDENDGDEKNQSTRRRSTKASTSSRIESKSRGEIARAIADGERQPFNLQNTELARRRREKGRGGEAYKEMALEFGG